MKTKQESCCLEMLFLKKLKNVLSLEFFDGGSRKTPSMLELWVFIVLIDIF